MKRICICCDGTWNGADQASNGIPHPTNVLRLAYRVAKRAAGVEQLTYYDAGVGTGDHLDRFTGGAFGAGLTDNVYDAYRFLIANYEPGDAIYMFGFSRGAFTVRRLVGMIRKCGILKRSAVEQYRAARELYQGPVGADEVEAVEFRQRYALDADMIVPIRFLGVWDTVGALGIPLSGMRRFTLQDEQFHDTELSGCVAHACQALAIDEHRRHFAPTLWAYLPKEGQTVEQVWFCGAHSDVGGGYVERGLADISLRWMMDRAQANGLAFEDGVLAAMALHDDPLAEIHDSLKGPFRFAGRIDRTIGIVTPVSGDRTGQPILDSTQSLHPSVTARWDATPAYRPSSLIAHFRRTRDPRVEALAPAGAR